MKVIIFDTETTGLPVKGDDLSPDQPWVLQLGAVMLEEFEQTQTMNILIKPPEGTVFHERAVQTHGLTEELCNAEGRDPVEVLKEFRDFCAGADIIAAYNLPFDERIIRTSSLRVDFDEFTASPVLDPKALHFCVMNQAAQYFKGRVRLGQAYQRLLGRPLVDAHDAFADTLAATEVFKHLIARTAAAPVTG